MSVKMSIPPEPMREGLKIGDLDDGGVYVGKSRTTGEDLHAALADEPKYLTYEEALEAAKKLKAVHPTAHVPTTAELNTNLYWNADKGALNNTFNRSGSNPDSCYRSSEPSFSEYWAKVQNFGYGWADYYSYELRLARLPVRLVW
jgi:hypothetical protein